VTWLRRDKGEAKACRAKGSDPFEDENEAAEDRRGMLRARASMARSARKPSIEEAGRMDSLVGGGVELAGGSGVSANRTRELRRRIERAAKSWYAGRGVKSGALAGSGARGLLGAGEGGARYSMTEESSAEDPRCKQEGGVGLMERMEEGGEGVDYAKSASWPLITLSLDSPWNLRTHPRCLAMLLA